MSDCDTEIAYGRRIVTEPEGSIARMLDAYKAAVFAKDIDAFASLYDPDVRVFDLWGKWSYDGIQAWRAMAAGWFESLGTSRVVVDLDGVRTIVAHDVSIVHAFVIYKGISADGRELHAMRNRLTWVVRETAGAWKVIHEHTSAPVDFETSKVILQS
jgi:uncharacterized protein (TIGR02246 family)